MKDEQTMPEHIINFDSETERNNFLKNYMRNEIRCQICENTSFKAERNSPEQIMLTCANCGWIHMIGPETFGENKVYLKFWGQEKK
ncbi:MAG: hypothetical protein WC325_02415 [Candidatus Bathyarchaeia archaeon]|jgi:translation initiation factor 2 beta subunit (eIF-2beta)/eIF-5